MQKFNIDVFEEFGRYNYPNTQETLPTHIHVDAIEICYLSRGCQEYFVGEETFKVYGGHIFMTFPNEIHGTGEMPEEKGILYWMSLKAPQKGKDYLGLSHMEALEIFNRLLHVPFRLFKGNAHCEKILQRIVHLHFKDNNILNRIELHNLIVSFLLNTICCSDAMLYGEYSNCIRKIVHYIEENLFEHFDLEKLAKKCNLSLSRFKHRFKEEIGIPPTEYIIRKKLEKARKLMDDDALSIKDIAYDLGFSAPTYFSTVFKQYYGYSPTTYKSQKGLLGTIT